MRMQQPIPALCLATGLAIAPSVSQAVLLNLTTDAPTINFGGGGVIQYDQATGSITISGLPSSLTSYNPFILGEILGTSVDDIKDISITFQVDNSGNVVANDANVPDLVIHGSIDTTGDGAADFSGILLTAEVTQFGFLDGASGGNDSFDLRLTVNGGDLAYLYTGQDLAVTVTSESSTEYTTPFAGNFSASWLAQASGSIGSVPPVSGGGSGGCHLKLVAECSVDDGPYQDKCRIKETRSPNHWERSEITYGSHTFHKSKYGMHNYPVPGWAANYASTNVKFKYTITNDGDNPVSDILIEDAFDTALPSYSTSLMVGDTLSVIRSINLNESIENDVTVYGSHGGEECGASDVVIIKEKLRDRKLHDDDDFKDKGHRD